MLKIPTHPNAQSNGYVFEHRVIFESIVGFYLDPEIVIHHINEDKQDNRFANLQMMDKSEHTILHHKGAKRSEETKKEIRLQQSN
ncbi:HNH endonuclease [Enterococcus termitis]